MAQRIEWEVLKSSGRWRGARAAPLELSTAVDGVGPGELFRARGEDLLLRVVPGSESSWRRRAEALVKLGHPNLLGIVGIGRLDGRVVLVEDLPSSSDLPGFLRAAASAGGPSLPDVSRIFSEVLGALRHVHGAQLTHGGIAAGTVHVGRDGVGGLDVRLSGAGILSGLREDGETVPPALWSTLAPELVESSTRATVAADLFAAGVLLLHILTGESHVPGGRTPWRELSPNPDGLRRAVRTAREDLPDPLVDLLVGLLAERPDDRQPKTTQELLRRVQKERWEPREVPVRAAKPSRPMTAPASEATPQARPLMIVTSRPVPRAESSPSTSPVVEDHAPAAPTSRVPPSTEAPAETAKDRELRPEELREELADDTLPVGAPSFHNLPHPITPAPVDALPVEPKSPEVVPVAEMPAEAASVEAASVEAASVEAEPPSTPASDDDELESTLPLSAAAVRSVLTEDAETTLPIGASANAFNAASHTRAGEVTAPLQGAAVARSSPRTIRPSAGITPPEPTQPLGPDLFAESPIATDYDDAHVPTSVKVGRLANPGVILPAVAVPPSPMGAYGTDGHEGVSPTMAVPGLAPGSFPSAPAPLPSLREEADEPLSATTKFAIVLTGVLVSIAIFVILTR